MMGGIDYSYISWFEFFLIAVFLYGVYYLCKRFKPTFTWFTGMKNLTVVNGVLVFLLMISFIFINPFPHGVMVLIGTVLFYSVLSSYVKGVVVTSNSHIEVGDLIKVGEHKGKVSKINVAGIKLLSEESNIFVPYKIIGNEAIEKYRHDQSRFIHLVCKIEGENTGRVNLHLLESVIFNFPFLEFGTQIEVKQDADEFIVHLTLANDHFKASLHNHIIKAGFIILQKTKV